MRLLLRHPLIDVNKRNEEGQTALHISAQKGHEVITDCLLYRGADPNLRDNFGTTPVFCAISGPCLSVLENLLSVSDLQVRGPHGESLLHWVVYNLCDPNDDHPLAHMALQMLTNLQPGLLEVKSTLSGHTPLAMAAAYCNAEAMNLLIGSWADVEARDSKGNSILSALSESNIRGPYSEIATPYRQKIMATHGKCSGVLIAAGADVEATNSVGETPLYCAIQKGNTLLARQLVWANCKTSIQRDPKNTDHGISFMRAALHDREEALAVFLFAEGCRHEDRHFYSCQTTQPMADFEGRRWQLPRPLFTLACLSRRAVRAALPKGLAFFAATDTLRLPSLLKDYVTLKDLLGGFHC